MKFEWIKLEITEEIKSEANRLAVQQRTNALRLGGSSVFQTSNALDDHVIGQLGMLGVHQYLQSKYLDHQFKNEVNGVGDGGKDMTIGTKVVDIKTGHMNRDRANLSRSYCFLMAKQQINKNVDFYINCQIDVQVHNLYIVGAIAYEDLVKCPTRQGEQYVNPCYTVSFDKLVPFDEWLEQIKSGVTSYF